MKQEIYIEKMDIDAMKARIKMTVQGLTSKRVAQKLKLRFSVKQMFPLHNQLLITSILFLQRTRFPLLLQFNPLIHDPIQYDKNLKRLYHGQLENGRLKTQFDFDHFLLISIKLAIGLLTSSFKWVIVSKEQEESLYCLLTQVLIGVNVYPYCYRLIQKKYIDQQRYRMHRLQSLIKEPFNNSSIGTKRMITMNAIQLKLQKRKLKTTRFERPSIEMTSMRNTMRRFKDELNQSLKVKIQKKVEKKERYDSLEQLVFRPELDSRTEGTRKKKVMHTEQISASMKLNLLLEQADLAYTRRDIILRHSNPSPRLTNQIYEPVSKQFNQTNPNKQNLEIKQKLNSSIAIPRKTRTYWNQMKIQIKQNNSQMLY